MITLNQTKPGFYENVDNSIMISEKDISKFPYGIKNMYRSKLPVVFHEERLDGTAIYVENEAGNPAYIDTELFELVSNHKNVKLFLTSRDLEGDRILFGVTDDKRIAVASYVYKEAVSFEEA